MRVWPLLWVRDLETSIVFWRERLGFALAGADGEPGARAWCRLERDGASVMLQQSVASADGGRPRPGATVGGRAGEPEATALYFVCEDVDAVHAELRDRGLDLPAPEAAPYGMKQLRVPEPDGHEVWFESPDPLPPDVRTS
jgi:catechol 2,3-dioxygenase-like lactoylglutathione lyase family enzyme